MHSITAWIAAAAFVVLGIILFALATSQDVTQTGGTPTAAAARKGAKPARPSKGAPRLALNKAVKQNGLFQDPDGEPFTGIMEKEHSNGTKKAEIPMRDGVVHGSMKIYDEFGMLRMLARYDNGSLVEVREWDKDGVELENASGTGDPFADLLAEDNPPPSSPGLVSRPRPVDGPIDTSRGVNIGMLQERGGVTYHLQTKEPYSGRAERSFDDGSRWERNFQNGLRHGEFNYYYPNGALQSREIFVDGKKDGLYTRWHLNGQKSFEAEIEAGKQLGITTTWDEDGKVTSRWEMTEDGQRINLLQPEPTEPQPEEGADGGGEAPPAPGETRSP